MNLWKMTESCSQCVPFCAGHLLVLCGVGRQLPVLHGERRDQERPHLSAAPLSRDDGSEQGGGERCEFVFSAGVGQKQQHVSLFSPDQDFISQWSLGNEAATEDASASQLGLAWLIPLWVDRDQEVLEKKVFYALTFSNAHGQVHLGRRVAVFHSPCSSRSQIFHLSRMCVAFFLVLFCFVCLQMPEILWQSKNPNEFFKNSRGKKMGGGKAGGSDSSDQVPTQLTLRSLGRVVTVTAITSLDARRLIFNNIILQRQASNFWKLTCVFFFFPCVFLDVYTPEMHQLSIYFFSFIFETISLPLLKHPHLPYLVSGAVRQHGPGRLFVLGSQRLPSSLRQLSEHQRRPVGDAAQHPPGPAGEQRGPQRGTVPVSAPPVGGAFLRPTSSHVYNYEASLNWHGA